MPAKEFVLGYAGTGVRGGFEQRCDSQSLSSCRTLAAALGPVEIQRLENGVGLASWSLQLEREKGQQVFGV